jgi:hypothetical protein
MSERVQFLKDPEIVKAEDMQKLTREQVIEVCGFDPGENYGKGPINTFDWTVINRDERWEAFKKSLPHLSDDDIDIICHVLDNVCNHCWEGDYTCQCMNDE